MWRILRHPVLCSQQYKCGFLPGWLVCPTPHTCTLLFSQKSVRISEFFLPFHISLKGKKSQFVNNHLLINKGARHLNTNSPLRGEHLIHLDLFCLYLKFSKNSGNTQRQVLHWIPVAKLDEMIIHQQRESLKI